MDTKISSRLLAFGLTALGACCGAAAEEPPPLETVREEAAALRDKVVEYKDHRLTWRFRHGSIELDNLLQGRFTLFKVEGEDADRNTRLRRARTEVVGWVGSRQLTYEVQVDWKEVEAPFAGESGGGLVPEDPDRALDDLYLTWTSANWVSAGAGTRVKLGQFTIPFGRQRAISSTRQQFVDRSEVSLRLTGGRDIGVLVEQHLTGQLFGHLGLFNGQGKGELDNQAGRYQYDLGLTWEPWGEVGLAEGDLEHRERAVVSLGLAVQHNNGRATESGLFRSNGWSAHFAGKRRGLSVLAEVLGREERLAGAPAANSWGFLAQAGWMVWRERLELAARLGSLDRPGSENDSQEVGVGFSWFLDGHALKLQGDVRALSLETQDDRLEGRLQLQVTF